MPGIFELPQELLYHILNHLDLGSLACAYECNKAMRRCVESFFSECYYKSKLNTPAAPCGDPYQILQGFLSLFDDKKVDTEVKNVLAKLHNSSDRGQPSWKEAVSIALKARGRDDASKYFYASKRNAFLIAARFGWQLEFGAELKLGDKCWAYTWMAYHGKLDSMKTLEMSVEDFTDVEAYNPVTMAAGSGQIDTLKHLHSVGFDLWPFASKPYSPLAAAIEHGHESVVKYLCDNDKIQRLTEDQVIHACRTAASNGRVYVLRQMEKQYPKETNDWYWNDAGAPVGLYPHRMDWYIFGPEKPSKDPERAALLQHFIQTEWYDIHAIDRSGNSVLHLAAAEGSVDLFQISWNAGANSIMYQLNKSGQSPIELAGNDESCIANWLSEKQRVKIPVIRNEKIKTAMTIIEAQRQLRIQHIVAKLFLYNNRKGTFSKDGLEKILEIINKHWNEANMDEKLADIWVHHYSITAMNGYIGKALRVIPPEPETLTSIFVKSLEDDGWFIRNSGYKEAKVKLRNDAEKAREIATSIFAFGILYSEPPLPQIFLGLRADLAELETYLQSQEGEMLKAGNQTARGHEDKVRRSFEEKLRGLDMTATLI